VKDITSRQCSYEETVYLGNRVFMQKVRQSSVRREVRGEAKLCHRSLAYSGGSALSVENP
jgi:hypothetical protein